MMFICLQMSILIDATYNRTTVTNYFRVPFVFVSISVSFIILCILLFIRSHVRPLFFWGLARDILINRFVTVSLNPFTLKCVYLSFLICEHSLKQRYLIIVPLNYLSRWALVKWISMLLQSHFNVLASRPDILLSCSETGNAIDISSDTHLYN